MSNILPNTTRFVSPNFWSPADLHARGVVRKPQFIVLHTTEGTFPSDAVYLCNSDPHDGHGPVSAHFVIDPGGVVYQLVDPANAAWHCYTRPDLRTDRPDLWAVWGAANSNYQSIGIEVSAPPGHGVSDVQAVALALLVADLVQAHAIPVDRWHIVAHSELNRAKTDPLHFDWDVFWARLLRALHPRYRF